MTRSHFRGFLACTVVASWLLVVSALTAQPNDAKGPDLSEFKTVETAVTTKLSKVAIAQISSPGYLGVTVSPNDAGSQLMITDVEDGSSAAKAGLQVGDALLSLDKKAIKNTETFRSVLQSKSAGETIQLTVRRDGKSVELSALLMA